VLSVVPESTVIHATEISAMTGIPVTRVRRALRQLYKMGMITVSHPFGVDTNYWSKFSTPESLINGAHQ